MFRNSRSSASLIPHRAEDLSAFPEEVDRGDVAPRYSKADAEDLQKTAEAATDKPLTVSAGAMTAALAMMVWAKVPFL